MYTIINDKTDRVLLKNIKLDSFKDYQAFIWKMYEGYSVNILITAMTEKELYIYMYDTYTDCLVDDIEINQADYESLIYPL